MVENINSFTNAARVQLGQRTVRDQRTTDKLSYLTKRLLTLAAQKGLAVGQADRGRLRKVDRYLLHKIDAAIEGGMRHMKVSRETDSRLLKNAFLQGTKKELWKLIKSAEDLPQALAARQQSDAERIADILMSAKENA